MELPSQGGNKMKKSTLFLSLACVTAAGAALFARSQKEKQKKEELDEFLMPDYDNPVVLDIPSKVHQDILSWADQEEKILPVTLYFNFVDFVEADKFQKGCASLNISSSLDEEDRIVEILYNGDLDIASLNEFAASLTNLMHECAVNYQGFKYFTK